MSFGEVTVLCELFVKLALASKFEHEKDAIFDFHHESSCRGEGHLNAGGSVEFQSCNRSACPLKTGQS